MMVVSFQIGLYYRRWNAKPQPKPLLNVNELKVECFTQLVKMYGNDSRLLFLVLE